jgi:hypothetical protein
MQAWPVRLALRLSSSLAFRDVAAPDRGHATRRNVGCTLSLPALDSEAPSFQNR